MRELGADSAALHATLAKDLVEAKIDRVYCCGAMMKYLFEALPSARRGAYAPDSTALAPLVANDLRDGDIVTVKGSKAVEMPAVIEAIRAVGSSRQKMVG
jgi:UDP-N-acetylmuramoyl-tripeptide--D-alanyl-D-alanine ligase